MEVELAGQLADEGVFRGFHLAARPAFQIVVAEQVQHAMDDIPDQFALPGDLEPTGLGQGFV